MKMRDLMWTTNYGTQRKKLLDDCTKFVFKVDIPQTKRKPYKRNYSAT